MSKNDETISDSAVTAAELACRIALLRMPKIGCQRLRYLLAKFGSAETAWKANSNDLSNVPGIGSAISQEIIRYRNNQDPAQELTRLTNTGVQVLTDEEPNYPDRLRQLADAPPLLFYRGKLPDWSRVIGVVGTRCSTAYGERQTARLAGELASAGILILSGLARGIDAAAHHSALQAGGKTAAILGSSPETPWPSANLPLYRRMLAQGMALLSEYPPGTPPLAGHFPARNRLVASIAHALLVIEAPEKSGALITANQASFLATDVLVVPGPADAPSFAGSHALIRDGAILVTQVTEILAELGWENLSLNIDQAFEQKTTSLSAEEKTVLAAISPQGEQPDDLANRLAMPIARVMSTLTRLELQALIVKSANSTYMRIN